MPLRFAILILTGVFMFGVALMAVGFAVCEIL